MENTSKNFALQLGALVALYVSITSLLTLLFGIINISFPDALTDYWEYDSAQSAVRFSIAILVVFFPTYIVLTRIVNTVRRKEHGIYLTLTKWLIYLSLLVAGAVLLGDLVAVINAYLNGEITQRFILKAFSVFVVIGAAFHYYLLDAKGYWNTQEQKSILYAIGSAVVVFTTLAYGFANIDTPTNVREQRFDQQQVADLQDMQWRIEDYYRSYETLPLTLDVLYTGREVPVAPESRQAYTYTITGEKRYELCAVFAYDVIGQGIPQAIELRVAPLGEKNILNSNWDYHAGETCFERAIVDIPTN